MSDGEQPNLSGPGAPQPDAEIEGLYYSARRERGADGQTSVVLSADYWPHGPDSASQYLGCVTVTEKGVGLRNYAWEGLVIDPDQTAASVVRAKDVLYRLSQDVVV